MRIGDLFAGIGGFSLGLEWAGMETVWQVESDSFCQKVLAKHWPSVKRYGDIHDFIEEAELGAVKSVDLIAGGPPCQPASVAGKRQGAKDDRWLWPETLRAVAALRPAWCLFENPVGFRSMGLDDVLSDLEGLGYACQTLDIPAAGVGAPHRRHRLWIVGHSGGERRQQVAPGAHGDETTHEGRTPKSANELTGAGEDVADAASILPQGFYDRQGQVESWRAGWWQTEPAVGRVATRVPGRMDRLRALGNAVVPQIPYVIGRAIMEAEQC